MWIRQNARSDRETSLAVGSHRACEADARIRYAGNAFKKFIPKKTIIGDVGCGDRAALETFGLVHEHKYATAHTSHVRCQGVARWWMPPGIVI